MFERTEREGREVFSPSSSSTFLFLFILFFVVISFSRGERERGREGIARGGNGRDQEREFFCFRFPLLTFFPRQSFFFFFFSVSLLSSLFSLHRTTNGVNECYKKVVPDCCYW